MACNFSCFLSFTDAQKENDVGVFQSDNGDVYRVKYKSNVCRDLLLRVEWTIPKQLLFTVKLYSTSFKRCFSSKGMVINGRKAFMKLRGAFNVSNSRNYKALCVINLIPYIKFNDSNELPAELFEDSGFIESEFPQSSMDENTAVTYEKLPFINENDQENRDVWSNSIRKINEINIPNKCKNARPVNDMAHVSSEKKNSELKNIAETHEMMIEDSNLTNLDNVSSDKSENSVPIMNEGSLSSRDHGGKITKNNNVHTASIQNSENTIQNDVVYAENFENCKNVLEDNLTEMCKDALFTNSNKQNNESALSNDKCAEENGIVRSNTQDKILITKLLTLDDYSEEIIENIKTINIHNSSESNDTFTENNSSMEVDLQELSYKSHSVLHDEDSSMSNSDNNTSKTISTHIAQEISQTEEMECHTLSQNKDIGYSQDVVNSKDKKTDFILESNDISINKNQYEEKRHGQEHLTNLTKCNIGSHIQNSELPKTDDDSILKCDSLTTDIQKSSEVENLAEINDTAIDKQKIQSPNISSSKSSFLFKTLVGKLSDCDLQLTDAQEEVESSSGEGSRNSLGSEADNRKIFPFMESEFKGLSMDMLALFTSGDMADAQITNGEKHIKVHRAIVSARSSALKKLFVKCQIDDTNYSAVVDIPSYIFEDVLLFLYVGLIYIKSAKMAQDLYEVAERYCINDLIDICSQHISL